MSVDKGTASSKLAVSANTKLIGVILLVALIGVGGFFVGVQYQKSKAGNSMANASANGPFGQMGEGGFGGNGGRSMNGSFGEVTAVDASSITIKDRRAGSTKTYSITDSTDITDDGNAASVSDIKVGDTVMVRTASSSSTEATTILLNPSFGGPGGQGGPGGMQSSDATNSSQDSSSDASSI